VVAPWKIALAYGLALLVAFASERLVPAWSGVLISAVFLYLPFWMARDQADPATTWGLHLAGWRRSLGVAAAWCGGLFPLFALAFGGYQALVLRPGSGAGGWGVPVFERARLERWDDDLYGEPGPDATGLVVRARPDDRLEIRNHGAATARIRIEGPMAERGVATRPPARLVPRPGHGVVVDLPPGGAVQRRWPAAGHVSVLEPEGEVLRAPTGRALGPSHASVALNPGLGWWLTFVLWQLAMIALSEELFFRGFVQTSLNARWTTRWRVLGAEVGWAWPMTALLFAAGHLATAPHPARLLVFFPGLLMGWLRERTGGLLAPIVFHGLANLAMELLVRLHAAR